VTVLNDYQILYNGVTMGQGTPFRLNKIEGLRELPLLRTSDYAKLKHHGAFSGIDVLEGRTVTFTMTIVGAGMSDFETQLAAFESAAIPLLTTSLPLSYKLPNQTQRQILARTRRRTEVILPSYTKAFIGAGAGMAPANVASPLAWELFCGDPRIYDDTLTTTAITTTATITNAGNFESRPVITVTPGSSPITITNAGDSSHFIKLATSSIGSIPNPCVIDLLARTVVDGSGANRFDLIDPTTQWFVLAPGANAITISGGTASVAWRSAWL
jgi:hypothetical protein